MDPGRVYICTCEVASDMSNEIHSERCLLH